MDILGGQNSESVKNGMVNFYKTLPEETFIPFASRSSPMSDFRSLMQDKTSFKPSQQHPPEFVFTFCVRLIEEFSKNPVVSSFFT